MLMAINPNSFFHLFGLVSLQGEREWREYQWYQYSWKALNSFSSSSVGVLECNLYVNAFAHICVFVFLFFFQSGGEWSGGRWFQYTWKAPKFSCRTGMQFVYAFVFVFCTHLYVFAFLFFFRVEWSEVEGRWFQYSQRALTSVGVRWGGRTFQLIDISFQKVIGNF